MEKGRKEKERRGKKGYRTTNREGNCFGEIALTDFPRTLIFQVLHFHLHIEFYSLYM